MKKFVIPIAWVTEDDNFVQPQVLLVEANDDYEALQKCEQILINREMAEYPEDLEFPPEIWNYQDDGDEEGYVLGDPVEITKINRT